MKSVRLRFTSDGERLHPMHEFVVDHGAFERTELHRWNPTMADRSTIVLEVFGTDVEAYETALTETKCILSYELSQLSGDPFFIVVDERLGAAGTRQTAAVTRDGLIVVPPVVFDGGGTVSITPVGTDETLQLAIERLPEGRGPEIVWVRECTGPGSVPAGSLSSRQREAIETTVDYDYYRKPRAGVVADIAARLDCSTSIAAEHLRKAEMKVMADLVSRL